MEISIDYCKTSLYVCNVDENSAVSGNKYVDQVREVVKDEDRR
jgi:ribosome-binding ATPase YchF (GTP1/OBG family)